MHFYLPFSKLYITKFGALKFADHILDTGTYLSVKIINMWDGSRFSIIFHNT